VTVAPVGIKPGKASGVIEPLNGICAPANGAVHEYGDKPLKPVIGRPP